MDLRGLRFVFLDRDGVLNAKLPEGAWVTRSADFAWLPGAKEAIARMKRAGLTLILVTNQRGIAVGLYTREQLEDIHRHMQRDLSGNGAEPEVQIDAIYYCPHDRNTCECRKPGVGLFRQAFTRFPLANPQNSVLIGDSLSDIQAGNRLGMPTIFIEDARQDADRKEDAMAAASLADTVAGSLLQAVEMHLRLPA